MDYIANGQATGNVANILLANNFDTGVLRPFLGDKNPNQSFMTLNSGKTMPTGNAATLRKDEWILLDQAVIKAAKSRLNAVADLRSAGLSFNIPNGMSKTVLQHQAQSDIGDAIVSMDGLREGNSDRPHYDITNLPLPIIHKDFQFSAREVATSRDGGSPLDTTMAELAARRVAEEAEKLTLGESAAYKYGGGFVYGYKNFPDRLTGSLTAPTPSNHATTVSEVLAMIAQAVANNYFGPYVLYYSSNWYSSMDEDYSSAKGDNTLKDRLMKISTIQDVKSADYLTGNEMILVQQTTDVARIVMGMDITTVQWESQGGMQLNYKVMAIMVPQLRSDFYGQTGIVHRTV